MDETTVEHIIFENLINSDDFFRKTIPHLKEEYFETHEQRVLFSFIKKFSEKYNKAPTAKILKLMAKEYTKFSQDQYMEVDGFINTLNGKEDNLEWAVNRTEKFCKDRAVFNSIMSAINIIDGKDAEFNQDAIPALLQEALSVSFDKSVGHDYIENAESRFDFYNKKEDRIPFRLSYFNKITKGGIPRKTLNCALAGVNVGKSLFLCDFAAGALAAGHNVLYITLEMAEERIAERIDCNLMDIEIDRLYKLNKDRFVDGINDIKSKTHGKLVIKEYPTGGAHVGHFRSLLDELKLKRNFLPDVICIDYINICSSQKYKSNNFNSYFAIKAIAEELRGLMIDYNAVGMTATQLTRGGFNNTDFDMTDTSESFGLPATLDMLFGIIRTEDLDKMGQLMIKQLKSRYNDVNYYKKFLVGVDIKKFKLFDVEESMQGQLADAGTTDNDKPLFDKSSSKSGFIDDIKFD